MTNILTVLPEFDIQPFTHLLPSLERALLSTADILTLEALDVAKRAQVPPAEVKKLSDALLEGLHGDLRGQTRNSGNEGADDLPKLTLVEPCRTISTLDDTLDNALGGGIATGYLTEFVGESAVGKTQFLLTLLLSVQLPAPRGLAKSALYISTEGKLQTTRLARLLEAHPALSALASEQRPSLSCIHSTHIHDVESQEHILRFQVPVAIKQQNIGLVVIDSIAANYRAEFDKSKGRNGAESFAKRSNQLSQLGALLRNIAQTNNVAIVVANQVADRFTTFEPAGQIRNINVSQGTQRSRPNSPTNQPLAARSAMATSQSAPFDSQSKTDNSQTTLSTDDPLALDHQQRFFTGWGDDPTITHLKTPSLGLTWTNQLAARIALLKQPIYVEKAYQPGDERDIAGWQRTMKIVFSAWCAAKTAGFEIWDGGIRALNEQARSE